MLWNSLMKKPILMIGIIMFSLFLYQVASKEKWGIFANQKLISTSCRGVLVGLEKRIPQNWKVFCEGNNLAIEIQEIAIPEKANDIKILLYRQLANHMTHVAQISAVDILEKVMFVRFRLNHPEMEINAVTEGKFIVKLATLTNPEHIMSHLKTTVQVKETIK
jgi:hypothetical protein